MEGLSIKELYERYKQDVFQYLYSLTHDISLAEDLTSETFLGAIKSLPKFEGKSDVKTWLFSIARYQWCGYLRKKKDIVAQDSYVMEQMGTKHRPMDHLVIQKELLQRIEQLLQRETERNRGVVKMRMEGYSYYEIGEHFKISENSARVIEFRSKGKIRDQLRWEGFDYE